MSEAERHVFQLDLPETEKLELRRERFALAVWLNAHPLLRACTPDKTARKMRVDILIPSHVLLPNIGYFGGDRRLIDALHRLCGASCLSGELSNLCIRAEYGTAPYLADRKTIHESAIRTLCASVLERGSETEKRALHHFCESTIGFREAAQKVSKHRKLRIRNARARLVERLKEFETACQKRHRETAAILLARLNDPALVSTRVTLWYLDCIDAPVREYQERYVAREVKSSAIPQSRPRRNVVEEFLRRAG